MNTSLVRDNDYHQFTLEEAQTFTAGERFHDLLDGRTGCTLVRGPRGALHLQLGRPYRVSGRLQTWKTRPGTFRVPIKHGMFGPSAEITPATIRLHRERECLVWIEYLRLIHERREQRLIGMQDAGLPPLEGVSE